MSMEPTAEARRLVSEWQANTPHFTSMHQPPMRQSELAPLEQAVATALAAKDAAHKVQTEALNTALQDYETQVLKLEGEMRELRTERDNLLREIQSLRHMHAVAGRYAVEERDSARTERDNLRLERDRALNHLANLLCRIHRDGGHYIENHGIEKACVDADMIVVQLMADKENKA